AKPTPGVAAGRVPADALAREGEQPAVVREEEQPGATLVDRGEAAQAGRDELDRDPTPGADCGIVPAWPHPARGLVAERVDARRDERVAPGARHAEREREFELDRVHPRARRRQTSDRCAPVRLVPAGEELDQVLACTRGIAKPRRGRDAAS